MQGLLSKLEHVPLQEIQLNTTEDSACPQREREREREKGGGNRGKGENKRERDKDKVTVEELYKNAIGEHRSLISPPGNVLSVSADTSNIRNPAICLSYASHRDFQTGQHQNIRHYKKVGKNWIEFIQLSGTELWKMGQYWHREWQANF